MSIKAVVSDPSTPMNVATTQSPTQTSYYDTFKKYIPCCNTAQPQAPRTWFSIGRQFLPTTVYLGAGIGTCVNAYSGNILNALYWAGGGLVTIVLHDFVLGGPPAPIITQQRIVDLERQQTANEHLLENVTEKADILDRSGKKEEQDLRIDVHDIELNNADLTHAGDIGSENEKAGQDLIDRLKAIRDGRERAK